MENLGQTIRSLRESKKLTLRIVAAHLDIDQAILSKIERGQRVASRELVTKLASYFKANENDLLVNWLSDKLIYEVRDEKIALSALRVAEEKIEYLTFQKTDRKSVLRNLKNTLKKFSPIKKAWIFGSFAREEDSANSDIDLLIDVSVDNNFTLFDLAEIQHQLQNLIKRKIDLVMLSGIRSEVKERIQKDLQLIYEA